MFNKLTISLSLIRRHCPDFDFKVFRDTLVTPLSKPLSESKVALVTTGGLYLKTDTPFNPETRYGDCSFRMLPGDVKHEDVAVSHKWYNHKFINADLNCFISARDNSAGKNAISHFP